MATDWVCLGVVGRPKGVRGAMRITTYTARPEDIAAYGPLYDRPGGRAFAVAVREAGPGWVVAEIAGVADRDAARALTGTRLYVPRSALPEPEEEETYYHVDLIGLRAETADGVPLGRVRAVLDFGAGDLLEIAGGEGGEDLLVPFTRAAVPVIDLAGGRLVVVPPETAEDEEDEDEGGEDEAAGEGGPG